MLASSRGLSRRRRAQPAPWRLVRRCFASSAWSARFLCFLFSFFFCSIFCSRCSLSLFRYRASGLSLEARSTNLAAATTVLCVQSATRLVALTLFGYRASILSLEARSTNLAAARTIFCEQSATRLLCSFFRSRCLLSLFRYCASVLSLEARSTNLAAAPTIFVSSPPPACCSSTVDSPTPSSVCVCSSGYLS